MKPTIGQIVRFVVDEHTARQLDGNHMTMSDKTAVAVIVRVWADTCVNLKVLGDGPHDVWVTSSSFDVAGMEPRSWHWPPRE